MDWVDLVATLSGLVAVVVGVLLWFGPGPALVLAGLGWLVAHWLLTDRSRGG